VAISQNHDPEAALSEDGEDKFVKKQAFFISWPYFFHMGIIN
jgi:hypothetical protein